MRLLQLRTLGGPSLHHDRPALVARLAVAPEAPAAGFADRLATWLGSSSASGDGLSGTPSLDVRPAVAPARAALPPPVLAASAVVRTLAARAGLPAPLVTGVPGPDADTYDLVVGFEVEAATRMLVTLAVEGVAAALDGDGAPPLDERLGAIRQAAEDGALGPSTAAIVAAAERRGIPWERVSEDNLIRLGWGVHSRFVQASLTGSSSAVAADVACDKPLTKKLLSAALLPVPGGEVVASAEEAVAAAERIGYPVVVKPRDGNHGRGVSVGLTTPAAVAEAFALARERSRRVIVEEQFEGHDVRVLVVDGTMVAAAERRPAQVVGDGVRTVAALVEEVNADPRRGEGHARALTRIRLDDTALACLAAQGHTPEHVPAPGEVVRLSNAANLSRGGTAHDVTERVHPEVRTACERAARVIGLDVCGVDLVAPTVEEPLGARSGIVELNAAPGLRMHLAPSEGAPRDVGAAIVGRLYPEGAPSRIPILAVTGTNGKTTVTRMIAHALQSEDRCAGMTTTDGVFVGGACVAHGDTTGPASARAVLMDPAVEVAVLETARGGIVRRGLGFDWCDLAVLTNVSADHLGQDGIRTVDDLYRIKRRLAERVRPGGTLVLNADDARLAALPDDPAVRGVARTVVYFSLDAASPVVARHRAAGGRALFLRAGRLIEAVGTQERALVRVDQIPVTMGGAARFQVANALAAAAALRAHGVRPARVAAALRSFRAVDHNAGRANLFRLGAGYVMLDYGHNPAAFAHVCALAAHWRRTRRVTGIVGVPGDREDAVIQAAGRTAAGGFTRLVVREDEDLRGRAPGETARLLCDAAHAARPEVECAVVRDGLEALRGELERVRRGDVAVVFFEKMEKHRALLKAAGAVPAEAVEELRVPRTPRRRPAWPLSAR